MIEKPGLTDSLVLDVFTSQAHDLLPCAFPPMVIDAQTLSPMNQPSIDAPGKSRFLQVRVVISEQPDFRILPGSRSGAT
jgi:hypothetical protein